MRGLGIRLTVSAVAFVSTLVGAGLVVLLCSLASPAFRPVLAAILAGPGATVWLCAAVLALALLCTGMGVWVTRSLRRRLAEVEEAAVLLGAGHLSHRVQTGGWTDEAARVGEQFNRMGARIEQQVALLQRLNSENLELAQEAQAAATLQERQRLARDLHDSVSQQLFALTMLSSAALRHHAIGSTELDGTLHHMADIASAAQREMRALLLQLRPVELADRSFLRAAQQFLETVRDRFDIACRLDTNPDLERLPPAIEEGLFRILQEGVANVIKHARASTITVRLEVQPGHVDMAILDDGVGISAHSRTATGGYGLRAMQERAEHLGGFCDVLARERGSMVSVRVPFARPEEGEQR